MKNTASPQILFKELENFSYDPELEDENILKWIIVFNYQKLFNGQEFCLISLCLIIYSKLYPGPFKDFWGEVACCSSSSVNSDSSDLAFGLIGLSS